MATARTAPDLLELYFRDIRRYPLLTRRKEMSLGRRARRGDQAARNQLVQGNLSFVVTVARYFSGRGIPLLDLIAAGNEGLIVAAQRYDPDTGYKFITYAVWWIKQRIHELLARQGRPIRVPQNHYVCLIMVWRTREALATELERQPSTAEMARTAGLTERQVADALTLLQPPLSLDQPIGRDDDPLIELLPDRLRLEDEVVASLVRDELNRALKRLTAREQYIVTHYFGLADQAPHTLEQIGQNLNLSRERVRQIKKQSLRKLGRQPRLKSAVKNIRTLCAPPS